MAKRESIKRFLSNSGGVNTTNNAASSNFRSKDFGKEFTNF